MSFFNLAKWELLLSASYCSRGLNLAWYLWNRKRYHSQMQDAIGLSRLLVRQGHIQTQQEAAAHRDLRGCDIPFSHGTYIFDAVIFKIHKDAESTDSRERIIRFKCYRTVIVALTYRLLFHKLLCCAYWSWPQFVLTVMVNVVARFVHWEMHWQCFYGLRLAELKWDLISPVCYCVAFIIQTIFFFL